jgi:hypothetical protein
MISYKLKIFISPQKNKHHLGRKQMPTGIAENIFIKKTLDKLPC